jgi:enoyl-[acyl-carrier protein] reductase/trans-2-enoyl-CoA reductase (NAD+)
MGVYAKSVNGDAFSNEIKDETLKLIKNDLGKIDLVVYSLASPRRVDPVTQERYMSVLKPIGDSYTNKSIDVMEGIISEITIEPANEEEIMNTTKVMGGEDWELWINRLLEEDLLNEGATTIAYSYIGPEVTRPIYRDGTIGLAKVHLENTAIRLNNTLADIKGKSYVVVAKALVTQASSAIPVVPLYIAALYKVMKGKGTHEGCIEQIYRLFNDSLYGDNKKFDNKGRIRIDDLEMEADVQSAAIDLFNEVTTENISSVIDLEDYKKEFFRLFGFGFDKVDYNVDVEAVIKIPSLSED